MGETEKKCAGTKASVVSSEWLMVRSGECGRSRVSVKVIPTSPLPKTTQCVAHYHRMDGKIKSDKNGNFLVRVNYVCVCISSVMAKCVCNLGRISALAPDLHSSNHIHFVCAFLSYLFILCLYTLVLHFHFGLDYLPTVCRLRTDCTFFDTHTHSRTIGWALILHLNSTHLNHPVWTRYFSSSKWANKESLFSSSFFHSFLVRTAVVGTTIGFIVYCLRRLVNAREEKKGPFHFHHYLMCMCVRLLLPST